MRFKIKLPPAVDMLLERLRLCGFQAYVVGGCVRDSILGKDPYDWDICTDALPAEVMGVFGTDNVIPTGLKHGTVTVKLESDLYEVTTFREDGEYSDGRHPEDVHFVKDIKGDLARRDFTINAMAYNPSEGFIDPFGGRKDIMRGVIRCVGEPDKRFEEDALRILRAARFQASLGFSIDWKTAQAMNRLAPDLERVSSERIGSELHKLLCAPYAALSVQKNREVLFAAIPELAFEEGCKQNNRYHYTDVFGHTLAALQNMQQCEAFPKEWADEYVCFALLFHDIGKPSVRTTDADGYDHFYGHPKISAEITDKILRERLRCSNEFRKTVVELVEHHDVTFSPTKACVRRMLNKFGVEQLHRLLKLRECDNRAHTPAAYPLFEDAMKFAEQVDIVLAEEAAFSLKDLAVKGKDLVAAGFEPGPRMGRILSALLEAVISEKVPNEKGELIEYAKRLTIKSQPPK